MKKRLIFGSIIMIMVMSLLGCYGHVHVSISPDWYGPPYYTGPYYGSSYYRYEYNRIWVPGHYESRFVWIPGHYE